MRAIGVRLVDPRLVDVRGPDMGEPT